jgi:hypothetical protein
MQFEIAVKTASGYSYNWYKVIPVRHVQRVECGLLGGDAV